MVGVHRGEKVGSAALRYQGYLEALEEAGVEFHMFPTEQIEMADKLNEEFVPGTGNGGDIQ